MIIVMVHILVFFCLIFKQTLIVVFSTLLLDLFLSMRFHLDLTELLQRLEDIVLTVLHLDRIYDLLNFSEDVVVLGLDPRHDLLPSKQERCSCIVIQHAKFLFVQAWFFGLNHDSKRLVFKLGVLVHDGLIDLQRILYLLL